MLIFRMLKFPIMFAALISIISCGNQTILKKQEKTEQEGLSQKAPQRSTKLTAKNLSFDPSQMAEICKEITPINVKTLPPLTSLSDMKQRFLDSHNDIRRRYGLSDLTWDNNLADYAQRWAQYLKEHNRCTMEHRQVLGKEEGKSFGENLGIKWSEEEKIGEKYSNETEWRWTVVPFVKGKFISSPEFNVIGWSQECQDYDYENNKCPKGKMCGHFTQVVWAKSARLGCGMVFCDGKENSEGHGRAELWVCNYDPPGNYIGQRPF
jgi:pathogenesis-related protein 1